MKGFYIVAIIVLLLHACGDDTSSPESTNEAITAGPQGLKGDQGDPGEPGKDFEPSSSLQGYYFLPFSGYLDLVEDGNGLYDINTSIIRSLNPDGTIATLSVAASNLSLIDGRVIYGRSVNLAPGNFQDDDGNPISTGGGVTYTYQVAISKSDDRLAIRKRLYESQDGTLRLVVDRTVDEE